MRLKGKTALVTGGGSGIGCGVAKLFAEEGAQVVITGRREDALKAACDSIQGRQPVRCFVTDVADREQVNACVAWVNREFAPIDVLVNNAGVNIVERSLEQLSPENWNYLMNVNATGAFNCIHAVLPQMRARKDGVIISISSIAGCRPSVLGGAAYSASKYAMTALTRLVDLEEGKNGIRATVIYPGEVDTPLIDLRPVKVSAEHRARILQPEDIAAAVLFVATLPPHVNVPELVIKPTTQRYA